MDRKQGCNSGGGMTCFFVVLSKVRADLSEISVGTHGREENVSTVEANGLCEDNEILLTIRASRKVSYVAGGIAEASNDLRVALPIQAQNRGRDGDLHGFSSHGWHILYGFV